MDPALRSTFHLRVAQAISRVALAFCWLACACTYSTPPSTPAPASQIAPPTASESLAEDWWSVYFTQPGSPGPGPDRALVQAIQAARLAVDVAVYDFSLWNLRDALIAAHRGGITVRMVTDSDNLNEPEIQALIQAGIPVIGDRREGLMHHKFVIIDRQEVWTGSMNFTRAGAYRHNNNLLRLRSTRLAQDYLTEFNEMFEQDRFGDRSLANTPFPTLKINDTPVEVYFSPEDGALRRLVEVLKGTEQSIYFLAYSFTADELAEVMLAKFQQGVAVAGVFDRDQVKSNRGGEYSRLQQAGIPVRLDSNPDLMHHKIIIVDQKIVITGSYNFSYNADTRNDENLLIIFSPALAQQFWQEFERLYQAAE